MGKVIIGKAVANLNTIRRKGKVNVNILGNGRGRGVIGVIKGDFFAIAPLSLSPLLKFFFAEFDCKVRTKFRRTVRKRRNSGKIGETGQCESSDKTF
jgi:hypothetical protein